MGNLDFLEKKPRIAYTLSWDGVTEGKVTNTQAMRKVYKISSEEFISRPDIVWTPTGSSGRPCNTPENIRLEKNYRFRNIEDVSNVSVSVLKEDKNKAGYYSFALFFGDDNTYADLFYVLVANKEIISGDFGNVNPIFPEAGWYFGGDTIEAGDIMSVLKGPLVQFSYSGKGFTSPKKPYRYISSSFEPDDDICIGINFNKMPSTDEEKSKGFNLFCDIKNPNIETNISLNEDLANIIKHCRRGSLSIMDYEEDYEELLSVETDNNISRSLEVTPGTINGINGLSISFHGEKVYFNPNISEDDYNSWQFKYFLRKP